MTGWSPADIKQATTEACMKAARDYLNQETSSNLANVTLKDIHFDIIAAESRIGFPSHVKSIHEYFVKHRACTSIGLG